MKVTEDNSRLNKNSKGTSPSEVLRRSLTIQELFVIKRTLSFYNKNFDNLTQEEYAEILQLYERAKKVSGQEWQEIFPSQIRNAIVSKFDKKEIEAGRKTEFKLSEGDVRALSEALIEYGIKGGVIEDNIYYLNDEEYLRARTEIEKIWKANGGRLSYEDYRKVAKIVKGIDVAETESSTETAEIDDEYGLTFIRDRAKHVEEENAFEKILSLNARITAPLMEILERMGERACNISMRQYNEIWTKYNNLVMQNVKLGKKKCEYLTTEEWKTIVESTIGISKETKTKGPFSKITAMLKRETPEEIQYTSSARNARRKFVEDNAIRKTTTGRRKSEKHVNFSGHEPYYRY